MIESSTKADTTREGRSPKKSIYWLGQRIDDFEALAKLLEMFNGTTAVDFAATRPVERIVFHPHLEGKASDTVTLDTVIKYIKTVSSAARSNAYSPLTSRRTCPIVGLFGCLESV